MERPYQEWVKRLRGTEPEPLLSAWQIRARCSGTFEREADYHLAVAERLRQLGNMAVDLDDQTRRDLCRQGNAIVDRLTEALGDDATRSTFVRETVEKSDAYFRDYGKKSARYYMYEQGVIDELGDRRSA